MFPIGTDTVAAFFYPQEGADAVAFHKSSAMDGRLTKIQDIAPIYRFLCLEGDWINGNYTDFLVRPSLCFLITSRPDNLCQRRVHKSLSFDQHNGSKAYRYGLALP